MRTSATYTPPPPTGQGAPDPSSIWVLVVAGWLFASLSVSGLRAPASGAGAGSSALSRVEASGDEPGRAIRAPREPDPGVGRSAPVAVDLLRSPPRDLRRLPGIGPLRAAAIAEWRWRTGGAPFALREVHGIGPRTEARALGALARAHPGGPAPAGALLRDGPR